MRVFAHRGLADEDGFPGDNTLSHFMEAFEAGYDVEMDVRRLFGVPVCTHDPILPDTPNLMGHGNLMDMGLWKMGGWPEDSEWWGDNTDCPCPSLYAFFYLLSEYPHRLALVGLKEDGLGADVQRLAKAHGVEDQIILFDNSMPDLVWNARNLEVQQAIRSSEYEIARMRKASHIVFDRFSPNVRGYDAFIGSLTSMAKRNRGKRKVREIIVIDPKIQGARWEQGAFRHDCRKAGVYGVVTDHARSWM